jgi:hypothetical protein
VEMAGVNTLSSAASVGLARGIFLSLHAGCAVRTRQLRSVKEPGLTELVRPNRRRQGYGSVIGGLQRRRAPPSSLRVKLGSLLNTFRRSWTINLYWRSFFKTNNDGPRFGRKELDLIHSFDLSLRELEGSMLATKPSCR